MVETSELMRIYGQAIEKDATMDAAIIERIGMVYIHTTRSPTIFRSSIDCVC